MLPISYPPVLASIHSLICNLRGADADYLAFLQILEQGPEQLLSAGLQREAQEKANAAALAINGPASTRPTSRLMESLSLKYAGSAPGRPVRTPGATKSKSRGGGVTDTPSTSTGRATTAKAAAATASSAAAPKSAGTRKAEDVGAKTDSAVSDQKKAPASASQAGGAVSSQRQGSKAALVSAPVATKVGQTHHFFRRVCTAHGKWLCVPHVYRISRDQNGC